MRYQGLTHSELLETPVEYYNEMVKQFNAEQEAKEKAAKR